MAIKRLHFSLWHDTYLYMIQVSSYHWRYFT